MTRRKRYTVAKAQRAITAMVELMETGELTGQEQAALDAACDTIREATRRLGR